MGQPTWPYWWDCPNLIANRRRRSRRTRNHVLYESPRISDLDWPPPLEHVRARPAAGAAAAGFQAAGRAVELAHDLEAERWIDPAPGAARRYGSSGGRPPVTTGNDPKAQRTRAAAVGRGRSRAQSEDPTRAKTRPEPSARARCPVDHEGGRYGVVAAARAAWGVAPHGGGWIGWVVGVRLREGLRRAHLENMTVNCREPRNARADLRLDGLRDRQESLLQPMPVSMTPSTLSSPSRQALHVPERHVMEYEIREMNERWVHLLERHRGDSQGRGDLRDLLRGRSTFRHRARARNLPFASSV